MNLGERCGVLKNRVRFGLFILVISICMMPIAHAQKNHGVVLSNQSFLNAHPDLNFRIKGMDMLKHAEEGRAFDYFKRAAFYADKPSQAMVATLYWEGRGVEVNRALAYAWMDLAAERRYPDFIVQRERYWNAMSEAEQQLSLAEGQGIYARYGDDVAQPRIAKLVRRAGKNVAGSRTGFAGNMKIHVPLPGSTEETPNFMTINGAHFYAPEFWVPEKYQTWHDTQWAQPRIGRVDVGELHDSAPKSRVKKTQKQQKK